jgi:hypothetical protein
MALYKQSEFAALCGISAAALSVNKNRGKVVVVDNLVDDTNQVNMEFLRRHLEKKGPAPVVSDYHDKEYPPTQAKTKPQRQPREQAIATDHSGMSYNELEKEKKRVDIKLVEERTELLRKQNEKIAGESLPTDMVKALFAQHFKSVTMAFKHSIDRIITDIAKKKDLTPEEVADIRGKLTANLNTAVKDAVLESKKTVAQIASSVVVKKELEAIEEPE